MFVAYYFDSCSESKALQRGKDESTCVLRFPVWVLFAFVALCSLYCVTYLCSVPEEKLV